MKKIILASVAATALVASLGAVKAEEPGEAAYFHERGNLDAALAQRGPGPDKSGWQVYGYGQYRQQAPAPLGYAPFDGYDFAD